MRHHFCLAYLRRNITSSSSAGKKEAIRHANESSPNYNKKKAGAIGGVQDSMTTRIMGSDWGDRTGQPISFAMQLYWGVFGIFILNGIYTYVSGKDGMFSIITPLH